MNTIKLALTAGAVSLMATSADAVTIMIDDFTTAQSVSVTAGDVPPTVTDNQAVGDVLGGFRTLDLEVSPPNAGSALGASLISTGVLGMAPSDLLALSTSPFIEATASVTYGVAAGGASLGDLTAGMTNDKFFFEILSGDLPGATFSATVTDGGGMSATVTESLVAGFSPFQAFADFVGVDFTDVASLTFTLESPLGTSSFDGSIGSISAVPVPASALLLLGGLGGFAAFSSSKRRRRKS